MMENFLNIPIKDIKYHLRKNDDFYIVDENINLFNLKTILFLIETIEETVTQIKIVFEKDKQKILFENLINQYGLPTHFYDENSFIENELEGDFTNWKIKKLLFVPYQEKKIKWSNNNIWKKNNYVIKLLDFSTIRGFDGEYIYLVYTRIIHHSI